MDGTKMLANALAKKASESGAMGGLIAKFAEALPLQEIFNFLDLAKAHLEKFDQRLALIEERLEKIETLAKQTEARLETIEADFLLFQIETKSGVTPVRENLDLETMVADG